MARKIKRGARIYRGRHKSNAHIALRIALTIVVLALLVVVGYSAGKPIMEYLQNRGSHASEPEWTPPPVTTAPPVEVTTAPTPEPPKTASGTAVELSIDALTDEATLRSALQGAKAQGFSGAIITLKDSTGSLRYKSANATANAVGASTGTLEASAIVNLIRAEGLTPIARIWTLKDHVAPLHDKSLGYSIGGSGSAWYDNNVSAGGRPWLSPLDAKGRGYISALAGELGDAGFAQVLYSGVSFPAFRNSDLNYIGNAVKDPARYKALLSLVSEGKQSVSGKDTDVLTEVSLRGAIEGTEEVWKPTELGDAIIVPLFDRSLAGSTLADGTVVPTELPAAAKWLFERVKGSASSVTILPSVARGDMSAEELDSVVSTLKAAGFDTVFVR